MAAGAILYGLIVILLGGLLTIAWTEAVNEIIPTINPYITAGDVTIQYVTYWNFVIALLQAMPILILIAVSVWSYRRAIERETGYASSPADLFKGVSAAFIGIFVSIVFFIMVGIPSEMVIGSFETMNISATGTAYEIASPWDMAYDDITFWMNLMYIVLILPALLGIIIMFLSAITTQDYDVISEAQQGGYGYSSQQNITAEEYAFMKGLK